MSPLEAAIRAVCSHIGADPNTWRGFEEIGRIATDALLEAMPPELADSVRSILNLEVIP